MSVLRRRARPPFKLLSLLLQYPGDEVLANRPAIAEAIAALPPSPARTGLERFFARFAGAPAVELQQEYVETFDLQRRCSLYLTYGTEGDTRRRGMALLRLKRLYAAGGLSLEGSELPDYLPVMLEFDDSWVFFAYNTSPITPMTPPRLPPNQMPPSQPVLVL